MSLLGTIVAASGTLVPPAVGAAGTGVGAGAATQSFTVSVLSPGSGVVTGWGYGVPVGEEYGLVPVSVVPAAGSVVFTFAAPTDGVPHVVNLYLAQITETD